MVKYKIKIVGTFLVIIVLLLASTMISAKVNREKTINILPKQPLTINGLYYYRGHNATHLGQDHDVGWINSTPPIERERVTCGIGIFLYFNQEGDFSGQQVIENIYYHIWFEKRGANEGPNPSYKLGYNTTGARTQEDDTVTVYMSENITEVDDCRLVQKIHYTDQTISTFENGHNFTNVVQLCDPFLTTSPYLASFVIFNVPDNHTLNTTGLNNTGVDSDGDFIQDYEELYVYYTNPCDPDTDNDGWPDDEEIGYGSDPNDHTDVPLVVETRSAEDITRTSARFSGLIVSDGGLPCEVRFKYTYTEIIDLQAFISEDMMGCITWTYPSDWQGEFHTNDVFEQTISDLQPGSIYVYRAGGRSVEKENWGGYVGFTTEP